MEWPEWWQWELEFSWHSIERMTDRGFSELDVRAMLEDAEDFQEEAHATFLVKTRLASVPWEVIVMPDYVQHKLIVVTAYTSDNA